MAGDFHLEAPIPEGASPEEVTDIRAKAFQTALMHAVNDPTMRFQMLIANAASRYEQALGYLRDELKRDRPEVRDLARRCLADPELMRRVAKKPETASLWAFLLNAIGEIE